jgi:hypothetical protein
VKSSQEKMKDMMHSKADITTSHNTDIDNISGLDENENVPDTDDLEEH